MVSSALHKESSDCMNLTCTFLSRSIKNRVCSHTCVCVCCSRPAFGAVLQGSLFGMAGTLPASYTTPIMSGQGLAGTFAAFSMICAIASKPLYVCLCVGGAVVSYSFDSTYLMLFIMVFLNRLVVIGRFSMLNIIQQGVLLPLK